MGIFCFCMEGFIRPPNTDMTGITAIHHLHLVVHHRRIAVPTNKHAVPQAIHETITFRVHEQGISSHCPLSAYLPNLWGGACKSLFPPLTYHKIQNGFTRTILLCGSKRTASRHHLYRTDHIRVQTQSRQLKASPAGSPAVVQFKVIGDVGIVRITCVNRPNSNALVWKYLYFNHNLLQVMSIQNLLLRPNSNRTNSNAQAL